MATKIQPKIQRRATIKGTAGMGVDYAGDPVIDPTANVIALNEAASKRQDDLREAERRYNDLRAAHQKEIAALRAEHAKELSAKESSRLDSIRQVDREDVAKTATSANLAIGTLAKQTTDLAQTLQTQVQTTAAAAEARRTSDMAEVNKRVSALELAGSASAGKQQVVDPMMAELVKNMQLLLLRDKEGSGKSQGISLVGVAIVGGVSILTGLLSIAGVLYAVLHQ